MALNIQSFFDEATSTFTYVVHDRNGHDAVVIDPVWDFDSAEFALKTTSAQKVIQYVQQNKLTVHYILETHVHADHISSSQILKQAFDGSKVAIGKNILKVQKTFKALLSLDHLQTDGHQFDRLLEDDELVVAGELSLKAIFTPGHTPACCCFLIEDCLFTGDAIFMPDFGTGRCDFPEGSAEELYHSITQRIYTLPDATKIYVGHDYGPGGRPIANESTVGQQKQENIHVKAETSKHDFVDFRRKRDATLKEPKLLYPSIQINVAAGNLPPKNNQGLSLLHLPLSADK